MSIMTSPSTRMWWKGLILTRQVDFVKGGGKSWSKPRNIRRTNDDTSLFWSGCESYRSCATNASILSKRQHWRRPSCDVIPPSNQSWGLENTIIVCVSTQRIPRFSLVRPRSKGPISGRIVIGHAWFVLRRFCRAWWRKVFTAALVSCTCHCWTTLDSQRQLQVLLYNETWVYVNAHTVLLTTWRKIAQETHSVFFGKLQ